MKFLDRDLFIINPESLPHAMHEAKTLDLTT